MALCFHRTATDQGGDLAGTQSPDVDNGNINRVAGFLGFAAQAAEVEVDVDLGTVRVLHIHAAHDVGRAINPVQVEGQVIDSDVKFRPRRQLVARIWYRHTGGSPITIGDVPLEERAQHSAPTEIWPHEDFMQAVRQAVDMGIGLKEISQAAADAAMKAVVENVRNKRMVSLPFTLIHSYSKQ